MYSRQVIEHFNNPRNTGVIPDADGVGTIGDPDCGDFVRIFITVRANRLRSVSYEICGCPASIATTSVITEVVTGKTLDEAIAVKEMDIVKILGGLPAEKIHCSNLGLAALRCAITNYLQKCKNRRSE